MQKTKICLLFFQHFFSFFLKGQIEEAKKRLFATIIASAFLSSSSVVNKFETVNVRMTDEKKIPRELERESVCERKKEER